MEKYCVILAVTQQTNTCSMSTLDCCAEFCTELTLKSAQLT